MNPHLIDWRHESDATWAALLRRAVQHSEAGHQWTQTAAGRSIALLFFNPSLRTRVSMELAAQQLGAHATTITPGQGTWGFAWDEGKPMDGGEAEHIREAVGVLSQYYDAIGVRVFASLTDYAQDCEERLITRFAGAATVPVVNLESAFYHPCQALADATTLTRHFGGEPSGRRFVLAWAHHPKALPMAVPNSALLMAARLGLNVTVARPEGYGLDRGVMAQAEAYAAQHGTQVEETDDLDGALDGAHVVYAKAWSGPLVYQDPEAEAQRRRALASWRITADGMQTTDDGVFMHCLPVRRGVVVDDAVLDGPQTLHLAQARNRLFAQKAILEQLWGLLP